jgi:putative iron-only hydrogenase system regulator
MKRLGVVGIVIENRVENAPKVNSVLTEFGDIIIGRLGVPNKDKGTNVIALIVEGTNDEFGALTGKLGSIKGVSVCSALSKE